MPEPDKQSLKDMDFEEALKIIAAVPEVPTPDFSSFIKAERKKERKVLQSKRKSPEIKEGETFKEYLERLDRFEILEVNLDEVLSITGDSKRTAQPLLFKMTDEKWKKPEHLQEDKILDGKNASLLADSIQTFELETGDPVAAATDKGIDYKDWNEDRVGVDPFGNTVFVVDGMGGQGKEGEGVQAAELLSESIINNWSHPQKAVESCIDEMTEIKMTGGACFASARVNKKPDNTKELIVTRIGDVKVLVIRVNDIAYESKDESLTQEKIDKGQLTEDQALHDSERNLVTNSVMAYGTKVNDSETVPIQSGDIVLVMSDGITDNLTPKEIIKWTKGAKNPEQIIQVLSRLTDAQMKGQGNFKMSGKSDNRGVAVIQIS